MTSEVMDAEQLVAAARMIHAGDSPEPIAPPAIPAAVQVIDGHQWMLDAKGRLTPLETVRAQDILQDDTVRRLFAAAQAVAATLSEFKRRVFDDVDTFREVLADRYGAEKGGAKGNITLMTYDGLMRVQIQVADQFRFGPELEAAKSLIDECMREWTADSNPQVRAIIADAFRADKEDQVNRSAVLRLRKFEFTDERWIRAMAAIGEAEINWGSKRYFRFASRPNHQAAFTTLSLDAATA